MTPRLHMAGGLLVLAIAWCGWHSARVHAQSNWSRVAVPLYTAAQFMQGVHRYWTAPKSADFASQSKVLTQAVQALCAAPAARAPAALETARKQWRTTMAAWERLATVASGAIIERRSRRQIDFMPTRRALIERAIKAAPANAAALESISAAAKGLPALEWLLWSHPTPPALTECRYAALVAADIEREALALQAAFELAAKKDWDEAAAVAAMGEVINQWIAGIERLRWPNMEKPLRAEGKSSALPRASSGSDAISWAAQWEALRAYATLIGQAAPQPGTALVPLESFLRGRGRNREADALVRATQRADARMQSLVPSGRASVMAAARELTSLKRMSETELAPALKVKIGVSDADGD